MNKIKVELELTEEQARRVADIVDPSDAEIIALALDPEKKRRWEDLLGTDWAKETRVRAYPSAEVVPSSFAISMKVRDKYHEIPVPNKELQDMLYNAKAMMYALEMVLEHDESSMMADSISDCTRDWVKETLRRAKGR